mgnify:FL=1
MVYIFWYRCKPACSYDFYLNWQLFSFSLAHQKNKFWVEKLSSSKSDVLSRTLLIIAQRGIEFYSRTSNNGNNMTLPASLFSYQSKCLQITIWNCQETFLMMKRLLQEKSCCFYWKSITFENCWWKLLQKILTMNF